MNKKLFFSALAFVCISVLSEQIAVSQEIANQPYRWKNVQMVGGGFVDGIVFHPTAKDVCYCRTDMGGAYRRNAATKVWEPILDWVSYNDLNLMGVESIAVDPSDPNRVYLSCGTYTNAQTPDGAILRSSDQGKTFQRCDVPFKMGGNENGRGNGERMSVDPNNGKILYLGTRLNGLWKSTDAAATWSKVENFPDITENPPATLTNENEIRRWQWMNRGCGMVFTMFDKNSGKPGKGSSTIYVGVSLKDRDNLYRSTDAGLSWQPVPGQPTRYRPTHAVLSTDGMLYVTYGDTPGPSVMRDGAVWKFNPKNGEWAEITPDKPSKDRPFGYAAVSVDSKNPKMLIVSSFNRYEYGGDDIFRSTDGGKTWKASFGNGSFRDSSLAPYTAKTGLHWMFDIEIDPSNSEHAMFTTGFGGYETFNLSDMDKGKPVKWSIMSTGIEETVALDLLSPPKGAHLVSAIGDYSGFVHWDTDKASGAEHFDNPQFNNTNGVTCAEKRPELIVRVGRGINAFQGKNIGYSKDGGKTWQPAGMPDKDCMLGHIAVSADGNAWVWTPEEVRGFPQSGAKKLPVYCTFDEGKSWTPCQGIPSNIRVIADKENPHIFYGLDLFNGKIYISTDNGASFTTKNLYLPGELPKDRRNRGDVRGGQDRLYATPGNEGNLWIAAYDGLYHVADSLNNYSKMKDVQTVHAFGFGKGLKTDGSPALYLIGTVKGIRGIFRSDDMAQSWVRINDDAHQWGLLLQITGDPKQYGRVYVGTHGRGTVYGDPEN